MKAHTAKQLSTYSAGDLRRWRIYLSDGTSETVWASSREQADALAIQKHRANGGKNVIAQARELL